MNKKRKKSEGNIKLSQECQFPLPEEWKGFPVHKKDWGRIMRMVDRIESPTSFWQIIWPGSVGFALSALLSAFTILEKNHPNKRLCYLLFGLGLIISLFSFIIDRTQKKVSVFTKKQLKEEMKKMEEPYKGRAYGT